MVTIDKDGNVLDGRHRLKACVRVGVGFASIITAMVFTSIANAQTNTKLHLDDGSVVRCVAVAESVSIETKYGLLAVPFAEISRIKFGLHPAPLEVKQLLDAKRGLSSAVFKEREIAKKTLVSLGRLSMPLLRAAAKSGDRDVQANAEQLLQSITETDPREAVDYDVVTTAFFPITGKIKAESLAFKSATLGEFTVPLGKIEMLTTVVRGETTFTISEAKTGPGGGWLSTGLVLERGDSLIVKASGSVDLWPATPGQYTASPSGYNTAGKGGQFLAGALVGRIGNGQPFMIGESATIAAHDAGELQLHIVPNPWNTNSEGQYSVGVRVTR